MSITVTGNDIHDVRHKLGQREVSYNIGIKWNRGSEDYGRVGSLGCIVDYGGAVPVEFKTGALAAKFIAKRLAEHDQYVKEQMKKRAKEMKAAAKKK